MEKKDKSHHTEEEKIMKKKKFIESLCMRVSLWEREAEWVTL